MAHRYYTPQEIGASYANLNKLPQDALCTLNFYWRELLVKQTEKPNIVHLVNLKKLAESLERLRAEVFSNRAVTIHSGWRSAKYNKLVGGHPNSFHKKGLAADIWVDGLKPQTVQKMLDPIWNGGLEYISSHTHIDIRGYRVRFRP